MKHDDNKGKKFFYLKTPSFLSLFPLEKKHDFKENKKFNLNEINIF